MEMPGQDYLNRNGICEAGAGSSLHEPIPPASVLGESLNLGGTGTPGMENLSLALGDLQLEDGPNSAAAVLAPEPLAPLHPLMADFKEWFYNWIPVNGKDQRGMLATVSKILKEKFANMDEDMMLTELVVSPHEIISMMMVKTFCQIALSGTSEVIEKGLENIMELIHLAARTESISNNITEGLIYLCTVTQAFYRSTKIGMIGENGVHTEEDFAPYAECCPVYDSLPDLAKNCIKAAKAMFWGSCRLYNEQLEILEQVVRTDPDTLEWKMYYFTVMRMCRKQIGHNHGRPVLNPLEWKLLLECREMDHDHKMVKILTCIHLSDVMKLAWDNSIEEHFILGIKFSSKSEVMDYIRAEAKDILSVMKYSVRANLHIVECLTSVTPPDLRDYEFAKICLATALARNPKSSKANHRMAVILIFEKNFPEATEYCKLALESDGRNYPGFVDYTSLLLRNPMVTVEEITTTLEKMKKNAWPNGQIAAIYCFEGILKFMMNDKDEAFQSFLKGSRYDFPQLVSTVKSVDAISKRFQWAPEACTVRQLCELFEQMQTKTDLDDDERNSITNLISLLRQMLNRKENPRAPFSRSWRGGNATANGRGNARGTHSPSVPYRGKEFQFGRGRPQRDMDGTSTLGYNTKGSSRPPSQRGRFQRGRQNFNNGQTERDPINPTPQSGRGFQRGRGGSRGERR